MANLKEIFKMGAGRDAGAEEPESESGEYAEYKPLLEKVFPGEWSDDRIMAFKELVMKCMESEG